MKRMVPLFLSVVVLLISVNTFADTTEAKVKSKAKALSLQEQINKAMREGEDYTIKTVIGKDLGFDIPVESKFVDVQSEDTIDSLYRAFYVVLDKPAEGETPKPESLIFQAKKTDKSGYQSIYIRTSLDGASKSALRTTGKYDENGKPVPGSGTKDQLDIDSNEVKTVLQREKDFWLKGKNRKQADAKAGNVMYYEDGMKAAQEAYQRVQALTAKPAMFAWDTVPASLAQLPPAGR